MEYYFPSDFVAKIFERLPVKSLIRFKSISKGCWNMISDSKFIKNHLKNMKSEKGCKDFLIQRPYLMYPEQFLLTRILNGHEGVVKAVEITPPPTVEDLGLLPTFKLSVECDGLLCIPLIHALVIWNPSTRAHLTISAPPQPFNHIASTLGFGYDSTTDDYKVVNISHGNGSPTVLHTLRLKTSNSWTISVNEIQPEFSAGFGKFSKTVDKCIYWIGTNLDTSTIELHTQLILCFDLEKERMREIMFPDYDILNKNKCVLGSLRGSLCLTSYDCGSSCFDVWVLNAMEKSWEKVLKFPAYACYAPLRYLIFVSFNYNGTQVLTNADTKTAELCIYNLDGGSNLPVKKIEIEGVGGTLGFSMTPYVESIVSPLPPES